MRISDWSSDVCSSDLLVERNCTAIAVGAILARPDQAPLMLEQSAGWPCVTDITGDRINRVWPKWSGQLLADKKEKLLGGCAATLGYVENRKSVGEGKVVSVRVDRGECGVIK